MISDLIKTSQIRLYIFQQTGVWVTPYRVKKWLKSGELARLQPADKKSNRYVRTKNVNEIIRERVK